MLVQSEGWHRFLAFVAREWGADEGGGATFVSAVQKASQVGDADAVTHLRQIVFAQKQIQALLRYPSSRLEQLKLHPAIDSTAERHPSRRGSL